MSGAQNSCFTQSWSDKLEAGDRNMVVTEGTGIATAGFPAKLTAAVFSKARVRASKTGDDVSDVLAHRSNRIQVRRFHRVDASQRNQTVRCL
jgi:hypothetical protein